jgi:hypothetical protein
MEVNDVITFDQVSRVFRYLVSTLTFLSRQIVCCVSFPTTYDHRCYIAVAIMQVIPWYYYYFFGALEPVSVITLFPPLCPLPSTYIDRN